MCMTKHTMTTMSPFPCIIAISLALATLSTAAAAAGDVSASSKFLLAHNAARRAVGVPPLAWNATLVADARAYASRARRDGCGLFLHPPVTIDYGWNAFLVGKADRRRETTVAEEAVASWVGERRWYDRRAGSCAPGKACSRYTQVVWRTTTQLGCAVAACRSGNVLAICEYYPRGNNVGERPY